MCNAVSVIICHVQLLMQSMARYTVPFEAVNVVRLAVAMIL